MGRASSLRSVAFFLTTVAAPGCGGAPPAAKGPPPAPPAASAPAVASPPAASAAAEPERVLAQEETLQTAKGAQVVAPAGWRTSRRDDVLRVASPEGDLRVAFVDVNEEDLTAAIGAAWKVVNPAFAGTKTGSVAPPSRAGWDDVLQVEYATKEGMALALARRSGKVTYVATVEAPAGAVERRVGQLNALVLSMKTEGTRFESFEGRTPVRLQGDKVQAFAAFIESAREALQVPGAAVAVVQEGKVVFEKGFGARVHGERAAVTPATLFMIGSISKSFTTLLMARLADEGLLTWDTPVLDLYPGFTLGDAETTKKLLLRHTVCACAGLPRRDMEFLFEYEKATPESRLAEMAQMKPTTAFGEAFQYSNSMVAAGGYLAAHRLDPKRKLGPAYDHAMATKVFTPLGMKSTLLDGKAARRRDHAGGHALGLDGGVARVPASAEGGVDAVRPAGGIWSNVRDMSRWLLTELAGGKTPEGKVFVSEANLRARYQPQATISNVSSYGLGLVVGSASGLYSAGHDGGTSGYNARAVVYPKAQLGLVVLANTANGAAFLNSVHRRLLELVFDGKEEAQGLVAHARKTRDEGVAEVKQRVAIPPEEAWLGPLLGEYREASLGRLVVRRSADAVVVDAGEWSSRAGQHKKPGGAPELTLLDAPLAGLSFTPETENGRVTLVLPAGQLRYVFEKIGAPKGAP